MTNGIAAVHTVGMHVCINKAHSHKAPPTTRLHPPRGSTHHETTPTTRLHPPRGSTHHKTTPTTTLIHKPKKSGFVQGLSFTMVWLTASQLLSKSDLSRSCFASTCLRTESLASLRLSSCSFSSSCSLSRSNSSSRPSNSIWCFSSVCA